MTATATPQQTTTTRPTRARIAPGTRREIGLPAWAFATIAGRVTGTQPPAVFTTLARHRGLFKGWLLFAGRLMPFGKLPRRESELVILRVAHVTGCAYERSHHELLGARAGLSRQEIERVGAGPESADWTPRDRMLLTVTDELVATRTLSDETWGLMAHHLDEPRIIELLMLIGHYDMLATTLNTIGVQPDAPR